MGRLKYRFAFAAISLVTVACLSQAGDEAADSVREWINRMAGATVDRGWSMLSDKAQATYGGDESSFRSDVEAVQWPDIQWTIDNAFEDDGTWIVLVGVDGGWNAVPQFIRDRPLAHLYCDNGVPAGFAVGVTFGEGGDPTIHPGVRTGGAALGRC